MRIDFEAPIKSQGFDKIASAEIKLVTEGSEAVRLPLTAVQLTAVFTLLDVSIDATGATLLGDD
ncbi:hypothetical protein [Gordonibacter sp.]|uniref:hypothetical protein n=1 Tax=Gordonibacter sp. TaxID=1968902 RepID=UPI002FCA16AD